MYPTGWKHTNEISAATTAITEFATGLEAPTDMVVPCEGFNMCLIALGTDGSGASSVVEVWGTQTDGEASQSINYCFNSELVSIAGSDTASVDEAIAIPGMDNIVELAAMTPTFQVSGVVDEDSTAIDSVHFFNRLTGAQTVPGYIDPNVSGGAFSADGPGALKYWNFISADDAGPAWIAVPCGPFNFLQFACTNVGGGIVSVFYNLLA